MKQFLRYSIVGVFNTLFGYAVIYALMYLARWSPELSNVGGYAAGLLVSYFLNRKFTFRSKRRKLREFSRFIIVFAFSYGANFALLVALIYRFKVDEGISQALAGVAYVLTSYVLNKLFVFRSTPKLRA